MNSSLGNKSQGGWGGEGGGTQGQTIISSVLIH